MKKLLKPIIIIFLATVVLILIDTIQARIFKRSPLISWKQEYGNSWVERGVLMDTYYCVKEKDIVTIHWLGKKKKFACPVESIGKPNHSKRKENIINLLKQEMINKGKMDYENVDSFEILKIFEYGYYRNTPQKKYLQINYKYLCKDGTDSCISEEYRHIEENSNNSYYNVVWIYTDEQKIYELLQGVSININADFSFESNIIE